MFVGLHKTWGQHEIKPNIVIFLSDDHGAEDAGWSGNPDLNTPVLDQLAREGMIFNRAYAPSSVCAPSRSALFTGLYPHRNGCDRNHGSVRPGIITLPDYLLPLGYRVVLAGKKHISPEAQFAFEYIELHEVKDFFEKPGEAPFCLVISMHAPHQPYFNHKGGYTHTHPKPWLPDTRASRQYLRAYYDHITLLDQEMGTFLYWIEKYGYTDALQIYTSDHGPAFPFAKWTLYEKGIRVPLIVKWPGVIESGSESNSLVGLVDLLPTLVEVAGGNLPQGLDGRSLVPHFQKQPASHRPYLYAAYTNLGVHGANEYPIRAIWDEEWKLIVNMNYEEDFQITRMDESDNRAIIDSYDVLQSWRAHENPEYRQRARDYIRRPQIELYHLKEDPHELNNLAIDADNQTILRTRLSAMEVWMGDQQDSQTENLRHIMKTLNSGHK